MITPIEQWVHRYLGVLPLPSLVLAVVASWPQFLALCGVGSEPARFEFAFKELVLPWAYVLSVVAAVALLELFPSVEELYEACAQAKAASFRRDRDPPQHTAT